jgi:hypothetical protein
MSSSLFLFRMSDRFGSLRSRTRILNIVGFLIGFIHCRFDPGATPRAFLKSVIDSVRITQAKVLQDERVLTSLLRMPGRHSRTCIIQTRRKRRDLRERWRGLQVARACREGQSGWPVETMRIFTLSRRHRSRLEDGLRGHVGGSSDSKVKMED